VRVYREAAPAPSIPRLAGLGALAFAAGLALAWAAGGRSGVDTAASPATAAPAEVEPLGEVEPLPDPEPFAEAEPQAAPVASADAGPPEPPPAPPGNLRFESERFAYLRCEGAEVGPRCRDEALEEAIRERLQTLPSCPDAPREAGRGDLRLEWIGATTVQVGWRDRFPSSATRLDRDAVLACARPALAGLRTNLPTARLLISYRFRLVEAD
jgi:hypothetical protein